MSFFYYTIKIRMFKFENDCLKTVGGDRFLMKWSMFAFLVCAFHKDPLTSRKLL